MNTANSSHHAGRYGRRDAIKLGGLSLSVAALVAACGDDRTGDTAPGRVGYAPPITNPPEYPIDDAVFLRTASSLELTAIAVYEAILDTGALDADVTTLVERLIENHQAIADEMGALTEAVGGVAWACTNPWYMDRLITPLLAAVVDSDNPLRDIINSAVALENIAAATHQTLTIELGDADAAAATIAAATLESRHSAAIVSAARGAEGYVSPSITGGETPTDAEGVPLAFAITDRFGSTGQIELVVGAPDDNGVRQTFVLQTPSLNSWIYNELEPSC
ncbi:MAG TPA: hypothetical protein VLN74_12735 [Ilumatobacteraceae bacterium]|nr:hypothetical protein [Ilumatobacteraceae bacterium]